MLQELKRVPAVSELGKPLGPTRWKKAASLLRAKKAVIRRNKLGIPYLKMTTSVGEVFQPLSYISDPGSKFDGVAVGSKKSVILTGMIVLPRTVSKKKKSQVEMRRARRFRNTPCRLKRFDNRRRSAGWISPSQKAKVDFRILVREEIGKVYPIQTNIVEDVSFNHYKNRWGKHFSTVEIGKTHFYNYLSQRGDLIKYDGSITALARDKYGLVKSNSKKDLTKEAHANDCVALLCHFYGVKIPDISSLFCWKRYEFYRRQLHKREYSRGGVRERYGGSYLVSGFKKGDVITGCYKGQVVKGVACSYDPKSKAIGIATFEKSQKWIVPLHTVQRLYHNPIMMVVH